MKRKILQITALAVAVASVFGVSSVSAANSNALGITPRKDYTVAAGQSFKDQLYLNNLSPNQDLDVSFKVIDFQAQNETGAPALNLKQGPPTPWSLRPYLKLPDSVKVPAGKSVNVPVSINIPAGQGAGSYYSAIQYSAQNTSDQKKLTLIASSATLMFVNIPGKTVENLNLLQFGAFSPTADDQDGSFSSLFVGKQPTELAYRARNNGNVAEQPSGSAVVKNAFGKQVAVIKNVNPKQQLALRGQIRRFQLCIKSVTQQTVTNNQTTTNQVCDNPHLLPGRYTAQLVAFYGLPGQPEQNITAQASFWYLPWWFLVIVLIVVALVVFAVMALQRKFTNRRSARRR